MKVEHKLLCVLVLLVPGLLAFKHFQQRIPNGDRVPHPCKPNYMWQGVGHLNKDGGGERNRFGRDFDKNGQKWDRCLCETDSDEDGKTNGEELGDPDCEWVPGATPKITALSKLSHPGVCDPHDSAQCQSVNDWEFCGASADFKCDAFDAEDVKNFTLQIPRVEIPAEVTTYMCVLLDVPTDGDWHVIGFVPELDNLNVMHHITVGLCSDEAVAKLGGKFDTPGPCGMGQDVCEGDLPLWSVGIDGNCMPESYGQQIGEKTRFTKAYLQYHYNNPEKRSDYTDASGLRYFYEPRKRPNDRTEARVSTLSLNIPPKQLYYEQSAVCSAECSREHFDEARYITEIFPHMHYMGRGFILEHYRGDQKLPDIVNLDDYSYDSPEIFMYDPPIEYRPGDKLVLRCFFNSMAQDKWTFFGENTYDEMCIAFISIFPPPTFQCYGLTAEQSLCTSSTFDVATVFPNSTGCELMLYLQGGFMPAYQSLQEVCNPDGVTCNPGCEEAVAEVHQHPCMQGNFLLMNKLRLSQMPAGVSFLHLLQSCEPFEEQTVPDAGPGDADGSLCPVTDVTDDAMTVASGSFMVVLLALITCFSTALWG